jgi:hypothetical protein
VKKKTALRLNGVKGQRRSSAAPAYLQENPRLMGTEPKTWQKVVMNE